MVRVQPTFVKGKKEGDVNSNSMETTDFDGGAVTMEVTILKYYE